MAAKIELARTIRGLLNVDRQPLIRQHVLYDIGPFDNHDCFRIAGYFGQLVGHDSGFVQAVKIKMMYLKIRAVVNLANREGRTGNLVLTLRAAGQAAHKGGFAAAQVAY